MFTTPFAAVGNVRISPLTSNLYEGFALPIPIAPDTLS